MMYIKKLINHQTHRFVVSSGILQDCVFLVPDIMFINFDKLCYFKYIPSV